MGLYEAMRVLLVKEDGEEGDDGDVPLDTLYALRLPAEQTAEVDVAYVPLSGVGATRYLGSRSVTGKRVTHDGGVLWYHKGVQFQVRGKYPGDPLAVMEVADWIRDVLVQYAGTSVIEAGEEIVRIDITNAPSYYDQDEQERPIMALTVEVWHRPSLGLRAWTSGFSGGFN